MLFYIAFIILVIAGFIVVELLFSFFMLPQARLCRCHMVAYLTLRCMRNASKPLATSNRTTSWLRFRQQALCYFTFVAAAIFREAACAAFSQVFGMPNLLMLVILNVPKYLNCAFFKSYPGRAWAAGETSQVHCPRCKHRNQHSLRPGSALPFRRYSAKDAAMSK